MGWDQTTTREDAQSFLLRFLNLDSSEVLQKAIEEKLQEQDLSFTEDFPSAAQEAGSDSFNNRIVFSDGRVFVETLTRLVRGDSWGEDHYAFVEAGKSFKRTITEVVAGDENSPKVTEETVPGDEEVPDSIESLRAAGNQMSPGMGDEIAAFFASQGIEKI